ncbi:translation initiation factor eIF-2 beta subunit [Blastocladiella emersonii ATCC 22665]|nr:translation initiation factor eIF-2 beta subunit [Blastocladiella emersonii ATCC 22665]
MSDHEINNVFDPSLMKKKKKKTKKAVPAAFDEEAAAAPAEAAPVETAAAPEADDEELDLSKMKKKKSKSKKVKVVPAELVADDEDEEPAAAAERDGEAEDEDEEPLEDIEDEIPDEETGMVFAADGEATAETWLGTDRDYTYDEILSRVFRILHEHNPALAGGRKRYTIVPPQVAREGSKKTAFANIADICNRMRRNFDHVVQFLYAELGTSGSVDGSQRLIIKGRFQPKQIENVLRRYIVEYVTCKTCKSPETILRKENRLFFMQCESCGSTRSVSAIQTGFKAQTGSRKAAKAKAAA